MYLPFKIWTFTDLEFALDGKQVYCPESAMLARWINRYDVVMSPFSVITETPPLGES